MLREGDVRRRLTHFNLRGVALGTHSMDIAWKREGGKDAVTITHARGEADLRVVFRIAATGESRISLNDQTAVIEQEQVRGVETRKVRLVLPA